MTSCMQLSVSRPALAQTRASAARPKPHAFTQQQRPPMRLMRWELMSAAAEAADVEAAEEPAEAVEEVAAAAGVTQDWAAERLARLDSDRGGVGEEVHYQLNFLWLDKNIGVAVDQVFAKAQRSPVTEYFFWPRADAWEELKACLETKDWVAERERVLLLNQCTEVINFWQEGEKKTLAQARAAFPDAKFQGQ